MGRLEAKFDPKFSRDLKRLIKRRVDLPVLEEVIELILENTLAAREELVRRHNMRHLSGAWSGSNECHVCNAGDWLLVWAVRGELAVFQRTGTQGDLPLARDGTNEAPPRPSRRAFCRKLETDWQ